MLVTIMCKCAYVWVCIRWGGGGRDREIKRAQSCRGLRWRPVWEKRSCQWSAYSMAEQVAMSFVSLRPRLIARIKCLRYDVITAMGLIMISFCHFSFSTRIKIWYAILDLVNKCVRYKLWYYFVVVIKVIVVVKTNKNKIAIYTLTITISCTP